MMSSPKLSELRTRFIELKRELSKAAQTRDWFGFHSAMRELQTLTASATALGPEGLSLTTEMKEVASLALKLSAERQDILGDAIRERERRRDSGSDAAMLSGP